MTEPAMTDPMLPLAGLSPVSGKKIMARFDGGLLSCDGGVLMLREVESRLAVAERLAACIADPRVPERVTHSLSDIIRTRRATAAGDRPKTTSNHEKTHLAADRTSCRTSCRSSRTKAAANQFRLFLHAGACWMMWGLRVSMPKRSMWRKVSMARPSSTRCG